MKMYLDCEFNGFGGELLSLALVPERGGFFYAELAPSEPPDRWVAEHVIPVMVGDTKLLREEVQKRLSEWLLQYTDVTIVVDWPDDIKYFCELLITGPGYSIKTPPKITFVLDRNLSSEDSEIPHNALLDAFAIKESDKKQ